MKLINNIDSGIFNTEKEDNNSIYKKEIFDLKVKLENILNIYNSFCEELYKYENSFSINKKNTIKIKKLEKILDLNLLYNIGHSSDYLLELYNTNIEFKKEIDVIPIHMMFKEIIQEYYDAINLIRMAKKYKANKSQNPLLTLFLESQNKISTNLHILSSSSFPISLISNNSVKVICKELLDDYMIKKDEVEKLKNDIFSNEEKLEKFMSKERKNNSSLEELRWYSSFLKMCCEKLDTKEKQKRID